MGAVYTRGAMVGRLLKWAVFLVVVAAAWVAVSVEISVWPPPAPPAVPMGAVEPSRLTFPYGGDLAVVRVAGGPYGRGRQQGRLVAARVRAGYEAILTHVAAGVASKLHLPRWTTGPLLDFIWWRLAPHVGEGFKAEMAGLADGAGIPYRTVCRVHAIPTLSERGCASFAATAEVTGGPLIHLRNLDWAVESQIQRFAQLTVVEPEVGVPFVNIGWSGFLGAVSGINWAGISIAEIRARSVARSIAGEPMVVRLRRALEEARTLDAAVAIVIAPPRTLGFNYLLASAREDRAAAVETNRDRVARFSPGDQREQVGANAPFAHTLPGVVVRASFAVDPAVRDDQLAVGGDPSRPGLEPPRGAGYTVRYLRQAKMVADSPGGVTVARAREIGLAIAPSSNLQSVVYAYPRFWVANAAVAAGPGEAAREAAKAARQPYYEFDLRLWFGVDRGEGAGPPPAVGGGGATEGEP